jgi:predicted metal-dependent enzyme (double-stranded beta helix superfamily)
MSYSLDDFCNQTRAILQQNDDHDGRDSVRQKLELLLSDPAFCATYAGPDSDPGVNQIFEDKNLKFCVLTYNMAESRTSPPHDHGGSWAVYGQVSQYTDMTIWAKAGKDDDKIEPVRQFRLEPGQAGLFDAGEIHSIQYPDDAKFVRVTGVDMSTESRRVFDPDKGTMRNIEHVGTGNDR